MEEDCALHAFGDDYSTTRGHSSLVGYAVPTMVMRGLRDVLGSEEELKKLQALTPDGELFPAERTLYRRLGIPEHHHPKLHGIIVAYLTGYAGPPGCMFFRAGERLDRKLPIWVNPIAGLNDRRLI